ncbi:cobyrinate a,c-diamide synthase [Gordonia sp. ABSL11-1]|uniref:cobyrinate a,c-diamide synthase n=1 Tax=Gordonia sp. ABSL11-1 TaxID=3053924 RepID=UPI002573348A|nr:cobyrinate a,c-diamide synthase [Gordonia sp. ABSL11-1]MDL9948474.1 cobyrinate a,c-diamide synthase [Gordonia sp. ABSL11-1]
MVGAHLPRVMIAAPASGHGKTTVATGLMAALVHRGIVVSGHKVGPDYIDPGYHSLATGRPGRNLDPFMVGSARVTPLLLHGAAGADMAIVEGVMGLFDGRLGTDGEASTAHVAALTSSPVVLVVDVSHASRTHAAMIAGLMSFDPRVRIAGVILNKARTERHADEVRRAVRGLGVPVLGVLPRDIEVETPSRHLGLVPVAERAESAATLRSLAALITEHIDLDAILDIARAADPLHSEVWEAADEVTPPDVAHTAGGRRPLVALAGGRAFTFRYTETDELLRAAGCDVMHFDPLTDTALPPATAGIYLGGGFPEVYTARLAENTGMLAALSQAIDDGVPTVAECAGFTYLCKSLDGAAAVGAVGAVAAMTPRLTLGYRTATAPSASLLTAGGEQVTGHEFHRTTVTPTAGDNRRSGDAAWNLPAADGFAGPTLHASYLHTHWAGHPWMAQRFADAVHTYDRRRHAPRDPLRHHGDSETGDNLIDFAVNVYPEPRPEWLEEALRRGLAAATAYPNAADARTALGNRHCRPDADVLPTAGAAEAFTLIGRLAKWHRPTIIHPQFTEAHRALVDAEHEVCVVQSTADDDFTLHPETVPDDADLVVVGNPTNPTGILHPADAILTLLRPGRVVLVDEAFMDAIPGEPETLAAYRHTGLLVCRSLTKQWSIPGVRAGYLVGDPHLIAQAARIQTPWSVSTPAISAILACSDERALRESDRRAHRLHRWRTHLTTHLAARGIPFVDGGAPFVLARPGAGVHDALRSRGIAVRRADTFPGLDSTWIRVAARDFSTTDHLLTALDEILGTSPTDR